MAKRKRIPYDPPGNRKRRRNRYDGWLRADQIFLSRRMMLAKGSIVAAFAGLAGKLGYMQLVEGSDYQAQAEENVISLEEIPAARGMILDRQGRTLADNRRTWEVRIVPAMLPDDPVERRYVLDTLIQALQLPDVLVIDPDAVPEGSVDTVFSRVAKMLSYTGEDLDQQVANWKAQAPNGMIRAAELTIDDAARFRAAKAEIPGVEVMNDLDYLVTNVWDKNLEISVKMNVPRKIAMTLDANSMYLPGVILDDGVLLRTYAGGEIMSHIIGYVQGIDAITLDDIRHLDENGERIYALNDLIGKSGLESALEERLRGKKGMRKIERDANGVQVRVIPYSELEPEPGENIRLTVDLELQNAAGKALKDAIDKAASEKIKVNKTRVAANPPKKAWQVPNAGSVVALDPRTGEVLAMVSYPYYDNQLFVTGLSNKKLREYNDPTKGKAFLNRATSELYPPGSTFKTFLAASALQRKAITTETTHMCMGGVGIPRPNNLADPDKWACWLAWTGNAGHGEMDVSSAIEQSCDVFFYNVAPAKSTWDGIAPVYYFDLDTNLDIVDTEEHTFDGEGIDKIAKDMKEKFFFGRETGIELGEEIGLFPDPDWKLETVGEGWTVGDSLNTSIGQGEVQVTPLQLTMNVAGIAMDGQFQTPHLVFESIGKDGKATQVKPKSAGKLGFDQEHLDVVKEGMVRVCNEEQGTAFASAGVSKWLLTNPEGEEKITVAGKTGTAEFGQQDESDGGARDTHGWFTAYAPADDPEIAVSVVIEAGGEGATFAVPVADALIRAYFELTGKRDRGKVLSKEKLAVS